MDPRAGNFQPTQAKIAARLQTPNSTSQNAIFKPSGNQSSSQDASSGKGFDSVVIVILEELCAIRRDVDSIGHGGWSVNIGPFQHAKEGATKATDAFKDRILEKLGVVLGDPPITPATAPHGDFHKPDNSKLLSELKNAGIQNADAASATNVSNHKPGVQATLPSRAKAHSATSSSVEANATTQSAQDAARNKVGVWQPAYIRSLVPLQDLKMPPPSSTVTFTWEFLQAAFQGVEWSPGLYYKPKSAGECLLPTRTYYAINATYEPYLPAKPGAHGAKLVPFFNNVDTADGSAAYEHVPLFISAAKRGNSRFGDNDYIYFGTYSQSRWSDKLDYDHIREHVPDEVKNYWAEQLSDPGRPDWVTKALMKHLVPPPEYDGVLPSSNDSDVTVDGKDLSKQMDSDVRHFIRILKMWEKDASLKAKLLKKDNVLEAFNSADADEDPGLRLWWEYLECVGWDHKFYEMLVGLQAKSKR